MSLIKFIQIANIILEIVVLMEEVMVEFLIVVNFLNFLQISKFSKIQGGGARNLGD